MDDFSINDERIDIALKELKIINKYLGGNSATKAGLKKLFSENHLKEIKILDLGGGASDILLSIKNNYKIYSADINKKINNYIAHNSPEAEVICTDAFYLPFKAEQFDVTHLSLFLHHFNEDEIKKILINVFYTTKYGVIINDLRRSVLAYSGIKILTKFFSNSELVKNDGPLSVLRGFKKNELTKILDELNIKYEINYKWAFRWLIVIYLKNE